MQHESYDVVIIGCGSAGIGAALNLLENKKDNFLIIEALDRIGGRFQTVDYGDSYLEMGAQWLHGEVGNPIFEFANKNQLLDELKETSQFLSKPINDVDLTYQGAPILNYLIDGKNETTAPLIFFQTQTGEKISNDVIFEFCKKFEEIMDEAESIEDKIETDYSFVDFFIERFKHTILTSEKFVNCTDDVKRQLEGLLIWRLKYECGENGCSNLYDLSLKYFGTYDACAGNQAVELKHGFKPVFDKMISNPSEFYSKLRLRHKLQRVLLCERLDNGSAKCEHCLYTSDSKQVCLEIRCPDDSLVYITCRHVVCTMSLGYLKENYLKLFHPSRLVSHDKANAIERLGFGTVNKIYLVYDKPFWPEDSLGYQMIWTPDENGHSFERLTNTLKLTDKLNENSTSQWYENIFAFESLKNNSNVICAWLYGSEYCESLNDEQIKTDCTNLLKRFLGNTDLPDPIDIVRSKWYTNEFFRGSYSHIAVGSTSKDIDYLAEPLPFAEMPLVLFAGEATQREVYSTIHGAFLSGIREAERIRKYLQNN